MAGRLSGGGACVTKRRLASSCQYLLQKIVSGSLRRACLSHYDSQLTIKTVKTTQADPPLGKAEGLQGKADPLQGKAEGLQGKAEGL